MRPLRVLIVEDDASVARFLKQACEEEGYHTIVESRGDTGLETARSHDFDLVLLDVMLPGKSGLEVCRALRQEHNRTAVLMITARDTMEDKIAGLDSGADDYIVKPFQIPELLARMRALLRRTGSPAAVLKVRDLALNPNMRRATKAGRDIELSSTEYNLLEYLMRNAGRVMDRQVILEHVWSYDFGGHDNVLDVYVSYLRSKIDLPEERSFIRTVRGRGYTVDLDSNSVDSD